MARSKSIENGVKYTVVLPKSDIQQLKKLSEKKIIDSINSGVREAVGEYIIKLNKDMYKKELMEAMKDKEYIKRNNDISQSFRHADKETGEMITEW